MKKTAFVVLCVISFAFNTHAQTPGRGAEKELRTVLSTFMQCIIDKDSIQFVKLFYDGPTVWTGVYKDKSQEVRRQKDSTKINNYFKSDPGRAFSKMIANRGKRLQEKFYHVHIHEDGYIAAITFDYDYQVDGKNTNWGKESWGLIKANGKWKITSIIFSVELESVNPGPRR
jgi:hypothetical protein